jgi:integrase
MLLARDAALRRSAIERFSVRNCDFDHREVVGVSKGWSTYRVPMTQRLYLTLWAVASMANSGEPFMQALDNYHRTVKACTLLWELRRTQRSLGLALPCWGLHDLRRTAARELYTRTGDIRKVQRLLGHTSPVCTWHYIGLVGLPLTAEDLEDAG